MAVYKVTVFETRMHEVEVEAETRNQAVERALELPLSEDSFVDSDQECLGDEEDVVELNDFSFQPDVMVHEEGWKYIA